MTVQIPEKLIIQHPEIDFGDRSLYGIFIGDDMFDHMKKSYKFHTQGEKNISCTNLLRGYVSTYILDEDGELTLVKINYQSFRKKPVEVHEKVYGNFWLDMRSEFFGDSLFVPFKHSRVVLNRDEWVTRK